MENNNIGCFLIAGFLVCFMIMTLIAWNVNNQLTNSVEKYDELEEKYDKLEIDYDKLNNGIDLYVDDCQKQYDNLLGQYNQKLTDLEYDWTTYVLSNCDCRT